ncbi:hypothetical protein DFH07DRAFT_684473, partial [Mycena maculata]
LILCQDNDSWDTGSGGAKATAMVTFGPGETPVKCRRARSCCKGCHACERIDPALRTAVRFELDPAALSMVLAAQVETHQREGNTPEENVATGNKCQGGPVMRAKPHGTSNDHQYFIACSGWMPKFKENHRTLTIPDHVNENLLAKVMAGQPLTDDPDKDTPPCSLIVHPHIGLKRRRCPHAHIVNGVQVQSRILNSPCPATRSIYVPIDSPIRKVLIVHNETGHNHPVPPLTKVTFELKDTWRECIEENRVLGATVSKIDNAQSTKTILGRKTPAEYAPALQNTRVKRDILHAAKRAKYPAGLDVAILPLLLADLKKPLDEHYIHKYITRPEDGGIIIITAVPYLLRLLDNPGVTSFDGDATFKRVEGEMNEWELSIFAKFVQRAASLVRAYINRASADFFEMLFDELQRVKIMITGKPLGIQKFVPGGNLLAVNFDMEPAQVIGFCRSVLKHSNPEYSGIPKDTPPDKIAPYFIKICWRHGKEPVNDFKSLVSAGNFDRLRDFVYIDSKEALDSFSAFVYEDFGLVVHLYSNSCSTELRLLDWWRHKEMHEWIIPCIVKSQSFIPADVWDCTPSMTNTNEAQHHWTNLQTGIKLSPVEALERAREVDERVSQEIQTSLRTGALINPNNYYVDRMGRSVQCHSSNSRRKRELREAADATHQLQLQIDVEAKKRRESTVLTKSLREQLKAAKGTSGKRGKSDKAGPLLSASSSGRVTTARGSSGKS